jgi:hypothetical protein
MSRIFKLSPILPVAVIFFFLLCAICCKHKVQGSVRQTSITITTQQKYQQDSLMQALIAQHIKDSTDLAECNHNYRVIVSDNMAWAESYNTLKHQKSSRN